MRTDKRRRPDGSQGQGAGARVFWVDWEYDRGHASNGVSRYATYVAQAAGQVREDLEDYDRPVDRAVALAVFAWRRATGPVMAPGFVATHPRVMTTTAGRDDHAGELLLVVTLTSTLPGLARMGSGWRSWEYDRVFGLYREPELGRYGRAKALLPVLTAQVPIPVTSLPEPDVDAGSGRVDWRTAAEAVEVICAALNTELGPVVAALDAGGGRS